MNINGIPIEELEADRAASLSDIDVCSRAMAMGITKHRDGMSVQSRIDGNRAIIDKIDAELVRRNSPVAPVPGQHAEEK